MGFYHAIKPETKAKALLQCYRPGSVLSALSWPSHDTLRLLLSFNPKNHLNRTLHLTCGAGYSSNMISYSVCLMVSIFKNMFFSLFSSFIIRSTYPRLFNLGFLSKKTPASCESLATAWSVLRPIFRYSVLPSVVPDAHSRIDAPCQAGLHILYYLKALAEALEVNYLALP